MDIPENLIIANVPEELNDKDELTDLLSQMRVIYNERQIVRDRDKELTAQYEEINKRVTEIFEKRELQNVRGSHGLAYKTTKVYPSVKDPDAFIAWLDAHGEGGIAKRSVHPQTLISWTNERMESGSELPNEEILGTFAKTSVALRK
jgi:hypothetical protein